MPSGRLLSLPPWPPPGLAAPRDAVGACAGAGGPGIGVSRGVHVLVLTSPLRADARAAATAPSQWH
eukprot:11167740-Lingulodinium_polyedra.AAC.1